MRSRRQRGGGRSQEEQDREALEQHFASIQVIPEQKTMPTLLPSLSGALVRAADTAPLKDQLRCGQVGVCHHELLYRELLPIS